MPPSIGDADITVGADTAKFDRDLAKSVKEAAKLQAVAAKAQAKADKDAAKAQAVAAKAAAKAQAENDKRAKAISGRLGDIAKATVGTLGSAGNALSTLTGTIGVAVPAISVGASALSALSVAAVQVGAAVGPLVAQVGAAGAAVGVGLKLAVLQGTKVASFAMDGLTAAIGDSTSKAKDLKKAMAELPKPAQNVALALRDAKKGIDGMKDSVQSHLFAGLNTQIKATADTYLPLMTTAADGTGDTLNTLAKRGAAMVQTGPWKKDFATVTKANNANLGLMGGIVLHLADAARSLLVAALPLTHRFLEWASGVAKAGDASVQAGRQTGGLQAWFKKAGDTAATLGGIAHKLGLALKNIFAASGVTGTSDKFLTTIQHTVGEFKRWTESTKGTKQIEDFFRHGRTNLTAIERLVKAVGHAFGGLAKGGDKQLFAHSLNQIRKEILPPIVHLLKSANTSGAFSTLISSVGKVIAVIAKMEEGDSSLKAFARALGLFADATLWIMQNVPGASKALSIFFTVMGTMKAVKLVGLGGAVSKLGGLLLSLTEKLIGGTAASQLNAAATAEQKAAQEAATAATARGRLMAIAKTATDKAAALATKAWTVVTYALGVAMKFALGPVGLIIIAIIALVTIFIVAYKKSETFRNIVNGALNAVKTAAGKVADFFTKTIPAAFQTVVHTVTTVFHKVLDVVKSVPGRVWGFLSGIWDKFIAAGNALDGFVAKAFGKVLDFIKSVPGKVWGFLGGMWDKWRTAVQSAKDFVTGKFQALLDWFGRIPGKMARLGKGMFGFIKDEIKGVLAGVVDLWNSLDFSISIHKSLPGPLPDINFDTGDLIPDIHNPFRATGGPVKAGWPYVVGEHRPELFVPDTSGRIEPSVSSGSSVTNNFTVLARDMNDVLTQAQRLTRHKAVGGVAMIGAR